MPLPIELIDVLQTQENLLDDLLAETADQFRRQTLKDVSEVGTNSRRIMAEFGANLQDIMEDTNVQAAGIMTAQEVAKVGAFLTKLRRATETDPILATFVSEQEDYVGTMGRRLLEREIGGMTPPERIKRIQDGTTRIVRAIVEQGVAEGQSSMQIAQTIEQYIRPTEADLKVKPYDYLRKKFPTIKASELARVPPGSVSYNSFLIARTESQFTFRQSVLDIQRDKPWQQGFKWNLSRSHEMPDICDEWAKANNGMGAGVYDEKNLPLGHPNDMCFVTTVLVPLRAFHEYLDTGEEPPKPEFTGETMTQEKYAELNKRKK
jgi:hypothetical protein